MYLVTKAQIRDIVGNVNIAEEFYPALNIEVKRIILKALERVAMYKQCRSYKLNYGELKI